MSKTSNSHVQLHAFCASDIPQRSRRHDGCRGPCFSRCRPFLRAGTGTAHLRYFATEPPGWSPRFGATHLSKGANGIWYMRLVVPEHIRAVDARLPDSADMQKTGPPGICRTGYESSRAKRTLASSGSRPVSPISTTTDGSCLLTDYLAKLFA